MIYILLLRSHQEILIPLSLYRRSGRRMDAYHDTCPSCGSEIGPESILEAHPSHEPSWHRLGPCSHYQYYNSSSGWSLTRLRPLQKVKRRLCPELLRSCRLVHSEAAPLLYQSNALRFEEAATLSLFRWRADMQQAAFVQNIHVMLYRCRSVDMSPVFDGSRPHVSPWLRYLTRNESGLAAEFSNLKGITISFDRDLAIAAVGTVRKHLELFAKHMYGLQWVQVIGVNDASAVDVLQTKLKNHGKPNNGGSVQKKTSKYGSFVGWENVSLWWGHPGSSAPYEIPLYSEDRRTRHRLFRIQQGQSITYSAGTSFIREHEAHWLDHNTSA